MAEGFGVGHGRTVTRLRWIGITLALLAACNSATLSASPFQPSSGDADAVDCVEGEESEACPAGETPVKKRDGGTDGGGDTPTASIGVSIQVLPSDSGAAILAAIRGAKTSVHMTMYLLTNNSVIAALGDLKAAGKDVKVILNKTFPGGTDNTNAYNKLTARGVPVVWASSSYTYTHAKTIVIDGEKAIIMTMNLTFTSPTTNREYIATDTDPKDVADLEEIFAADYESKPITVDSKLVVSPGTANSQGSPRNQLKALIDSATTSLDVEIQSLSDTTIVNAIIARHKAEVPVRVVMDGDTNEATATGIRALKAAGVPLHWLRHPNLDVHAKVIVADGARTFVGSQNFTATALNSSREIGVITDDVAEAKKVRDVIAEDFAQGVAP